MKSVIVKTEKELKLAMKDKSIDEIEIQNYGLINKIKIISKIKKTAPWLIGAICIAIPLIPFTGGTSLVPVLSGLSGIGGFVGATGAGAGGTTAILAIVALCVAIGGSLVISLFTDWEEVEIGNYIKLKRKGK